MGQTRLRLFGLVAVALMLAAACGGSGGTNPPAKQYKIGLVTDIGGLNDKSFKHPAYDGLQKTITDLNGKGGVKETKTRDAYIPTLTNFAPTRYALVSWVDLLM